ncbi:hypothetical protein MBLNU457_g0278t1 [Dothideomycetes sp. NU457]
MAATAKQLTSSTLSLPPDTYIYTLARLQNFCAAISSDDTLTYFDPSNLSISSQIKNANNSITSLCASHDGAGVATAGRDGLVKVWDPRRKGVVGEYRNPKDTGLSALAMSENLIAAGTESTKEGVGDVSVLIWDARNPTTPLRTYTDSHNDTITSLAFHPTRPSTLLSSATDGLISLFNTTHADEDDAIIQVLNHYSAVQHAGFATADEVYAVSSDEQLSVYGLREEDEPEGDEGVLPATVLGDVRPVLGVAYVVGVVRGGGAGDEVWVCAGDANLSALSLTPLRPAGSVEERKWELDSTETISLKGAHGEEVVRDILLLTQDHRILTCGEDGHVRLWSTPESPDAMDIESGKSKKSKRKEKASEKARYKPY